MPRNLRSIVAQVTSIRGSVRSSRKFSSTSSSEGGGDGKARFLVEMGFLVCAIGALENLLRIRKTSESEKLPIDSLRSDLEIVKSDVDFVKITVLKSEKDGLLPPYKTF